MKTKIIGLFISLPLCIASLQAQEKLYKDQFPLSDVTLLEGPFRHARDLNIQVLLQYDVDRLLAPYRKVAGLPEKAPSYPNWDGLDGHVAGHYLSAMAINYAATGNEKYLVAARRFSHRQFLEPLSKGIDNLDNKHANTQIPKFIGFTRIAELSGDSVYKKAGRFSWETIVHNRTLAFGGNSRREHFPSVEACADYINDVDGPETCNSYNMLKLTEDLFRMCPSAHYADYYERTLFNHILSTQHPGHGGYVYFTTARPRHYRVYSTPNNAMWCCVGTGMENHSKYNQFIYTHTGDSLYLNLFIPSELKWRDKKIRIRQETNFPYEEGTKLTIIEGVSDFPFLVRYPEWVKEGALKISVNGKEVAYTSLPSSYICINRKWEKGDVIEIELPMHNRIEQLPNVKDYIAFLRGPILLGARSGTEDMRGLLADDGRWAQYPGGKMLPVDQAPILVDDDIQQIADKLVPIKNQPMQFKLNVKMENPMDVTLEPFANIHDSRYMIYWLALTSSGYSAYKDSLTAIEKEKIAIEERTIDFVATGEQQPETDHAMQAAHSTSGNSNNQFYRDASGEGYFSYEMNTNSETNLTLLVRYWGAEWGGRKFDIYIDDEKLLTEDNTGRWNQSRFFDVAYAIPNSMVRGKEKIRVKFQSLPGNTAGAVYFIRLLRKNQQD